MPKRLRLDDICRDDMANAANIDPSEIDGGSKGKARED